MLTRSVSSPAFGEADLSNCEREQIHLAGSIQPHGALLLVRDFDNVIIQASENAATFLAIDANIVGQRLDEVSGDLAEHLRPHLDDPLHDVARGIHCTLGHPPRAFDGLIHRPSSGGLLIELEPVGIPPARRWRPACAWMAPSHPRPWSA